MLLQLFRPSSAILPLALLLLAPPALAGSDDEDHENHYKDLDPVENDDFRLDISDAHSQADFVLFRAKLSNKTGNFLVLSKTDASFDVAGRKLQPGDGADKRPIIVEPHGKASHTFKVKGDGDMHVDALTVDLAGISRVAADASPVDAPDFQLPAARNDFRAGPFKCKLDGVKQETKQTVAKFTCAYEGKGVGFVDAPVLGARLQGGQEFANVNRKAERKLLLPGDEVKFDAVFEITAKIVDMQFATFHIVWRETFSESKLEALPAPRLAFELDPAKTAEKNGEDKKK